MVSFHERTSFLERSRAAKADAVRARRRDLVVAEGRVQPELDGSVEGASSDDLPLAGRLIPIVADEFIRTGKGSIKVIPTSANWFGVTYKEDAPSVQARVTELVDQQEYPNDLWA